MSEKPSQEVQITAIIVIGIVAAFCSALHACVRYNEQYKELGVACVQAGRVLTSNWACSLATVSTTTTTTSTGRE
jgi:hypothetical protein